MQITIPEETIQQIRKSEDTDSSSDESENSIDEFPYSSHNEDSGDEDDWKPLKEDMDIEIDDIRENSITSEDSDSPKSKANRSSVSLIEKEIKPSKDDEIESFSQTDKRFIDESQLLTNLRED